MLKRCLLALLLCSPVWADKIYVRNRPFEGYVAGSVRDAASLQADAVALGQALGFYVTEEDGNCVIRRTTVEPLPQMVKNAGHLYVLGEEMPFHVEDGKRMVRVAEFANRVGARLRHNKEVGTLDIDLIADPTTQGTAVIPGVHHLVFFGADWAPASKLFKPVVQEFERKHIIPVVFVDCTQPRSVNYRTYIRHFHGNQLPYTVLLNPSGRAV